MDEQPNPIIPQEQPAQQPQRSPNKAWQIVAIVVAGILVIGGVAYGSYYWWQNLSKNTTPSVSASPSSTPDETADWQTYKNEQYGFEFKYPQNWISKVIQTDKVVFKKTENENQEIIVVIQDNSGGLTVGKFLEVKGFDLSFIKNDIELQGYKGVRISPEGLCSGDSIQLAKDDHIISIAACIESIILVDQILSTFKFIDPTADWQTYRNEEYGYEFKYPQEIFIYNDLKSENAYLANKEASSPMELGSDGVWLSVNRTSKADGWIGQTWFAETGREQNKVYFSGPKPNSEIAYAYFIYWANEDALYQLSMNAAIEENLKRYQVTFNQILSTFKLTK